MPTVVRTNGTFATVRSAAENKKYGANPSLLYLQSTIAHAFISFPSLIPKNAVLHSATLEIRNWSKWSGSRTMTVRRVTSNWKAGSITYAKRPLNTDSGQVSVTKSNAEGEWWSFDVTAHIQSVLNGAKWYGWRVHSNAINLEKIRGDKGGNNFEPRLTLVFSYPTTMPDNLSPGSSSDVVYVSSGKPTLSADYNAGNADKNDFDGMQVQMSTTGVFTPPTWDSGMIATVDPELVMTDYTGSPTVVEGGSMWWRTRMRGDSGIITDWSAPVQYFRKAKSVATLISPALAPNDQVRSSTPDISWTFSGIQSQFQITITDPENPATFPLWDSGIQSGPEQAVEVPELIIKKTDKLYQVNIKVWDDVAREPYTEAGVFIPAYSEVIRNFKYVLSGSVLGVQSLSTTFLAPLPHMRISWDRNSAPDNFEIIRNGDVIDVVDPTEVFYSGTSYRYVDKTAAARGTFTWEVRAVVSNQASSSNPTKLGKLVSGLAWLSDNKNNIHIAIAGEAPAEVGMFEQGETFSPVNSGVPVRLTSALGGYQGTVTGVLCGDCLEDGTTSEQLQERLLKFRKTPGKKFQFSLDNISVTVVIYNVSTYPMYGARFSKAYGVEFEWHQVSK